MNCVDYLQKVLSPSSLQDVVRGIVRVLQDKEFDAIVCRGLSGLSVAPIVAFILKKPLVVVRKGENCHSDNEVEHTFSNRNWTYVIIDDQIDTGETIENIIACVSEVFNGSENPVGICLYEERYVGNFLNGERAIPTWFARPRKV